MKNKIIFNCNSEMSENENKIIFDSVYQGEYTIQNLIKSDNNCSAHFRYERWRSNGKNKLSIVTYNPKSETSFLLHSIEMANNDDIEIYECMYDHVVNLKKTLVLLAFRAKFLQI